MKIERKEFFILFLCFLIGFVLRVYNFDKKSLWMDEIHTYNDSRDDFKGQIKFFKENPTFLHPPLFFILTHQFHPFTKPERDLRIIPLIFGTLSIPMIYLLARQFSASIALPCTLSLTFMTYHISLSQDGRSYSLLMFVSIIGFYFLMNYLKTFKKSYLVLIALSFTFLFLTSYSSIPLVVFSQILWFYRPNEEGKKPILSSFLILNGCTILLYLPWIIFLGMNYKGQSLMDPFHTESTGSLGDILYGVLNDWMPHAPLMITSSILLILFPLFSKNKKNAMIILLTFISPIGALYLFCKLFNVTHFISSRYFINFLPLFLITLYLSLEALEMKFEKLKKFIRLKVLFLILLIISNVAILPLYFRSEKENFRGLVVYLEKQLLIGDKIFVGTSGYIPGILHYFGFHPGLRHHYVDVLTDSGKIIGVEKTFTYKNEIYTIYHSTNCCTQYISDGSRLWIIVDKMAARKLRESSPAVLKGYFDGSFLNYIRFPIDESLYLFLWDPKSQNEKGITMPIE